MGKTKRYKCWYAHIYKGRGYARPHFFSNFGEQTMKELLRSGNIFFSEEECLKSIAECLDCRIRRLENTDITYDKFQEVAS
jgi:hypothetical protein